MDESGSSGCILLMLLFLVIDFVVFGFGTALRNLNEKEIEQTALADGAKSGRARVLLKIMAVPRHYYVTAQFAAMSIHMVIGCFYWKKSADLLVTVFSPMGLADLPTTIIAYLISGVVILYLMLTFAVIFPRRFGARDPEKFCYITMPVMQALIVILYPICALISVTADLFGRLFGMKTPYEEADVTEDEIISMVNEGHEQGVLQASEAEMITNIFELGDKEAQDIMTHRTNIIDIDGNTTLSDAIVFMLEENKSRYPVYEDDIDHIIGILHFKDAIRMAKNKPAYENKPIKSIKGLLMEAKFIPETRNINALFKNMQSMKVQMVVVIDEYGQTAGLVAMEDILEEIVGNILDEHDEDEAHIRVKNEKEYIIEGLTPIEDVEELLGISLKEDAFETLNGFMISKMEHIPEDKEKFETEAEGYRFRILKAQNKMVQSVLVTKLEEESRT
ncbi:MAG: HlyC/CorC family transporter [Lachnospiraceae bacterium]|nr:HlyC/CorC family transporter [Lachnospiraceae bacterium]